MLSSVRGKFRVNKIELYDYPEGGGQVSLSAVYGGDKNSEDNTYSEATPSGEIKMMVSNPPAFEFFRKAREEKKAIYCDFTLAQ